VVAAVAGQTEKVRSYLDFKKRMKKTRRPK
jgi:hypothetical protein